MSEQLPELPEGALAVLSKLQKLEPPAGVEARLFERLASSIAAGSAATAGATAVAAAGVATKTVVLITAAALAGGLAGGAVLGRTVLAADPVVIEKVRTVEVVVEKPVPVPVEPPPVPRKAEAGADTLLAREREQIDTARSALLHSNAASAMAALEAHAKQFPKGRLAEERESPS